MGPKQVKKPLGRPAQADWPGPILWQFEPPFGLGLLLRVLLVSLQKFGGIRPQELDET
jgi:hypothetical protein